MLLSEQGEVKLTDFGIAKAMNKREQTGTGVVKGKVAFMSPEQAMGKPIDQRSDIFSLGTMLYLLMMRARPFEGPTDLETLLRVQKGDFRPPEAVAPDLEPEVAAIINRVDEARSGRALSERRRHVDRPRNVCCAPCSGRWDRPSSSAGCTTCRCIDGHPSIGKAPERVPSGADGQGQGELDGKDVVLFDSQELDEEEVVDGEAVTSLAVVEGGGGAGRMRLSRRRGVAAPSLPVPRRRGSRARRAGQPARNCRCSFPTPRSRPAAAANGWRRACSRCSYSA